MKRGLDHFAQGRLDEASRWFQHVLKYDPQHASAHLAQAAVYAVQARHGDRQRRELAEVGYLQALRFDPGNAVASHLLGLLYLDMGRYEEAMNPLAIAAMNRRHDPRVLAALAAAAYGSGRPAMAWRIMEAALRLSPSGTAPDRTSEAEEMSVSRNAALMAAAAGRFDTAQRLLNDLRPRLTKPSFDWLSHRVQDWRMLHAGQGTAPAFTPLPPAEGAAVPPGGGPSPVEDSGLAPAGGSPFLPVPGENRTDASGSLRSTLMAPLPRPPAGSKARMVQVDVTLIRTEEIEARSRGVNLLDGLHLQFGRTDTRTASGFGGDPPEVNRVITRALSIPEISYSLNIANDSLDRADVLARPSLVALDGQPANFFSGEEVSVAIPGSFSGGSLTDKTIGMELAVTPTFLDDDTVLLAINASRGFVNPAPAGSFAQSLRTTRQRVTTSVAVDFGQTLILSGLSERQSETVRSGVPVLQELPGLQYLFSSQSRMEYLKSVIILLTPRAVGASTPPGTHTTQAYTTLVQTALQRVFPEFFQAESHLDAMVHAARGNPFVRAFRREDMDTHQLGTDRDALQQLVEQLRSVIRP